MSGRRRTAGAWWGLLGASALVAVATVVATVAAVWSVQADGQPGSMTQAWALWVSVATAAATGVAATLVAGLRRWGALAPPAFAVLLASFAAGAVDVDWRLGMITAMAVGTAGALFGVRLADVLQAPESLQADRRVRLSTILSGLACVVAVLSVLALPVMVVVDTAAEWTATGLLVVVVTTATIAGVALWRPTLPVWVWLALVGVGAGVVWLGLPEVGEFAALVVPVVALAVLGFTYPFVAGWTIGVLGVLLWPPLMVAGALYLAAYGALTSQGRTSTVDSRPAPTPPPP